MPWLIDDILVLAVVALAAYYGARGVFTALVRRVFSGYADLKAQRVVDFDKWRATEKRLRGREAELLHLLEAERSAHADVRAEALAREAQIREQRAHSQWGDFQDTVPPRNHTTRGREIGV